LAGPPARRGYHFGKSGRNLTIPLTLAVARIPSKSLKARALAPQPQALPEEPFFALNLCRVRILSPCWSMARKTSESVVHGRRRTTTSKWPVPCSRSRDRLTGSVTAPLEARVPRNHHRRHHLPPLTRQIL
jgi:hypothetical protein